MSGTLESAHKANVALPVKDRSKFMRIQINTFAFIAADTTSAADKHRHAAEYTDNQRVIMYLILLAKNVPLPCGVLLTPPGVQCDNCATK